MSVYFDEIEDAGKQFIRFDKNLRDRSINPKLEIGKLFHGKLETIGICDKITIAILSYPIDQSHKIIKSDSTRIGNKISKDSSRVLKLTIFLFVRTSIK